MRIREQSDQEEKKDGSAGNKKRGNWEEGWGRSQRVRKQVELMACERF